MMKIKIAVISFMEFNKFSIHYRHTMGKLNVDVDGLIEKAKCLSCDAQFDILFALQDIISNVQSQAAFDCLEYCVEDAVPWVYNVGSLYETLINSDCSV